jgi:nicotinamide-nucleotide amidase
MLPLTFFNQMHADLITIGDEILIGQIIDTNSAWMGKKLNDEGIDVRQITSISDKPEQILETLADVGSKSPIVLITGGLGPTRDDLTKTTICQYFETELIENAEVLKHIEELLAPRGVVINQLNRDQALVPRNAIVLFNKLGTAPGLWLSKGNTTYVFMPGVPFEMKYLMENEVLPRIRNEFHTPTILHKTVLTQGLPESMLAEKIADWETALPEFIKLAYLPSPQSVRLRLSARGNDRELLQRTIDQQIELLSAIIPKNIFGFDDDTIAGNIGKIMTEKGLTISSAESCTGGNIARLITENPGSSKYYKGSVVAYSNEAKCNILGVDEKLISTYGAVSREVAEAMAKGARKLLATDFAVSTTGIAGPDGGTPEKPVGLVWIAVAGPQGIVSNSYNFGKERDRNITRSTQTALNMVRNLLIDME